MHGLGTELSVEMSDQLQGQLINPRQALARPVAQPRQRRVAFARQVSAGGADVVLDQVVVVQQPDDRFANVAPLLPAAAQQAMRFLQRAGVLFELAEQAGAA